MTARQSYLPAIAAALRDHASVVVTGERGLGLRATARAAIDASRTIWELDGDGHAHGYLAGFEPFVWQLLDDAAIHHPALVAAHEQSLKRLWPRRDTPAYTLPRDLTSTSKRDERTRFYHHEYQNKLLVGLAEFILAVLAARNEQVALLIDNAHRLPPTSLSLLAIVRRLQGADAPLHFVLLDRIGNGRLDESPVIAMAPLTLAEFEAETDLAHLAPYQRTVAYRQSGGNPATCAALATCLGQDFGKAAPLAVNTVIDLYLGTQSMEHRQELARDWVASACQGNLIAQRNAATLPAAVMDALHHAHHLLAWQRHAAGQGSLVLVHALAIQDPLRRLQALVEPCDVLMGIGLYDTWFAFFAELFSSTELRHQGSGDDPINGLFINTAFVLYSMGYTAAALAFLDDFLTTFPASRFVPTALYAQSMTYGRYQIPVNLPAAEDCAVRNLRIIEEKFSDHPRHTYIKVFAENAYAYIKARQGKFDEALALCEHGIAEIVGVYGEDQFQLHRSILIYNTSQVYELVNDLDRAESRLRTAIACDPFYAEYYNDLGNLLSRASGREEEALAAYAQAIALAPPYYEAYLNRGMLRAQLGNVDGAQADFERALRIKPAEWRALRELGNLRLLAGEAAAALTAYDQALQYEAHDADLLANAAVAASELGDSALAIQHGEAAIIINPRHASAHNNLAAEFTALGFLDEALRHICLAAGYDPDPQYLESRDAIIRIKALAPDFPT
jgi:tetratricopeptide (TPR) repeat protein